MPLSRLLYFASVVRLLIAGLNSNQTYLQIATILNSAGLKTAYGKSWTKTDVQNTIRRIRNPSKYSSSFYRALLTLTTSEITVDEAAKLLNFKAANNG